jgi:hypothetical protein
MTQSTDQGSPPIDPVDPDSAGPYTYYQVSPAAWETIQNNGRYCTKTSYDPPAPSNSGSATTVDWGTWVVSYTYDPRTQELQYTFTGWGPAGSWSTVWAEVTASVAAGRAGTHACPWPS